MKKFNFLGNLLRREFVMSGMSGMNGLRADAVNPDSQPTVNRQTRLTSEQRHYSLTSARVAQEWLKYAAVFVMLLTVGVGNAWGTELFNVTSYSSIPSGWTYNSVTTGSYFKFDTNGAYLISPLYNAQNGVTLTCKVACFGSGTNHALTIQLLDENGTVKSSHTSTKPTSSSYVNDSWSIGDVGYKFKIKFYLSNNGKGVRLQVPKLTYANIETSTSSITGLDYVYGSGPSAAKSFTVTGSDLTGNLTVSAPTNFEVSTTSGSGYGSSVTLTASSGAVSATVYVRLASGKAVGSYGSASTYVTVSGGSAATKNVSVQGTVSSAAACTATPSIGAASLNGSFNLSSVGVSCASSGAGTNCSITEYGWVWSDGTNNTNPTIGGSGVTNYPKTSGTPSGSGGSFTGTLSGSFTLGHTYYYKAYVTNGKPATEYSAVQTFTPRSVTFDLNGHGSSAPSTQYVNNGGKATDPSYSESVSGWVFGGWYKESSCTNAWTFGTDVVSGANKTLYAKWTQKCSTPTFTPTAGTHTGTQSVTISCAAPSSVTIRYTTDGTTPTKSVGTVYSGAISVSATTTIKAIAYKDGCVDSEVASGTFTIKCATPTFSVAAGTKHGAQSVELNCATANATIYYTTDNSTPTASSTEYTGTAINVSTSQTIKAIAVKSGLTNSDVASAAYTIQYQVTWTVNGDDDDITPTWVNCGSKPTFPDAPDACDATSTTFVGWTQTKWTNKIAQSAVDEKTTDATKVHTSNSTMPNVTANVTYHAVWAKATGTPSDEWELVKSTSSLNEGDKVVFGHNNTGTIWLLGYQFITPDATDATRYYNRKYASNTETVSSSKITVTSSEIATTTGDTEKPYVLTVGKSGDYWTFYDGVYGGYLYTAGVDNSSDVEHHNKNLLYYQAELTDAGKWALTINSTTGAAAFTSQTTSGTDRNLLKSNGTTETGVFSSYKSTSSNIEDPYIFKNLSTVSYSDYLTTCCDKNITIGNPSITGNGAVTFTFGGDAISAGDVVETCSKAQNVVATVTPSSGYECTSLTFSGGSVSVSPTPGASNYPAAPSSQNYTLSFAQGTTSATLATSVTFTAKSLTSISLAEASINVYVGEIKYVDVVFNPTDILSKAWSQAATPSYCQLNSYDSYNKLKITGGRAGADVSVDRTETVGIKYTADNTKTASISVTVKPLPIVTFVDLIHNKSDFTNSGDGWTAGTGVLSSTVTTGVVSHTKKTPKHTDVAEPGTGNSCEKTHLHLIGWIRSDYSKVADYLSGTGSAPTVSELTNAGSDYWFLPDASINTETYNGKTFYAVWGEEDE